MGSRLPPTYNENRFISAPLEVWIVPERSIYQMKYPRAVYSRSFTFRAEESLNIQSFTTHNFLIADFFTRRRRALR
jgi:hypothetical protein